MTRPTRLARRLRFGGALLLPSALLACPSERYTRPPGPAPRYETAPLAPWAGEAAPGASEDEALESAIERALAGDAGPAEAGKE